jgi:hypothetical protein
MGMLIRMHDEWSKILAVPECSPLFVTVEDRKRQEEDEKPWNQGVELLAEFLARVGAYQGWDGWVNHQNYEVMKERLRNSVESFLDQHARTGEERHLWLEVLPFKDDHRV